MNSSFRIEIKACKLRNIISPTYLLILSNYSTSYSCPPDMHSSLNKQHQIIHIIVYFCFSNSYSRRMWGISKTYNPFSSAASVIQTQVHHLLDEVLWDAVIQLQDLVGQWVSYLQNISHKEVRARLGNGSEISENSFSQD